MVCMLLSNVAVDGRFESRLGPTKTYKMDICCFSDQQAALKSKSKDWFARN